MIIALCGLRRCGKDTVAHFLASRHGFEHVKIAEKLKRMVKDLFDFTDDQLETDAKELVDPRWGVSPRKLMQFFGTEIMQEKIQEVLPHVGRNFFVQRLLLELPKKTKPLVISDMRFLHEYNALKCHAPITVVEIQRPLCVQDPHKSEQEYVHIPKDFVLHNHTSVTDLYSQVDIMLNQIGSHGAR